MERRDWSRECDESGGEVESSRTSWGVSYDDVFNGVSGLN